VKIFTARLADFDLRRPASKRDYNRRVFRAVAPRYGVVTRLLSFGMDAWWKRALVTRLRRDAGQAPRALDLACGTGDLSLLLARRFPAGRVEGLDLGSRPRARRRRGAGRVISVSAT
jgi:demethylmenaquinone methyltransferase/2-methoxy-6-polyprenyl-1,4-benzoquinol methylase